MNLEDKEIGNYNILIFYFNVKPQHQKYQLYFM